MRDRAPVVPPTVSSSVSQVRGTLVRAVASIRLKPRFLALILILSPFFLSAQSPATIEFVRFTPAAIFGDGVDTTSVQVRVVGPVKTAQIILSSFPSGIIPSTTYELFDDGTNGDERSGDQIFSRSDIKLSSSQSCLMLGGVRLTLTDGTISSQNPIDTRFYPVAPSQRLPVDRLNDDVQVTSNLVNLRDDGRVFRLTPSTSTTSPSSMFAISSKFYEYFPDDYDFIAVFSTVGTTNGTLYHNTVRNAVQGTGSPMRDSTSTYRSAGRLQGMNFLGLNGGGGLLHETMHQWAAFLDASLELNEPGGHWAAVNIPGHVFGIDFNANDDGTYTITQGTVPTGRVYPPMELYLMGLIPPEQVPDVTVLRGIGDPRALRLGQVVRPTSVRNVTMSEIIAIHGPRVPSVEFSQKEFRMAGVLITPGRLATAAEMVAYSRTMTRFGSLETAPAGEFGEGTYPFAFATGNRAHMDTTISSPGVSQPVSEHALPFTAGSSLSRKTTGQGMLLSTGYATLQPTSSSTFQTEGLAVVGSKQNGVLVSETAMPSSAPITRGRIFAELTSLLETAIAIANTSSQPAQISFYFTDANGRDLSSGSLTLPAGAQLARFLTQNPFNVAAPFIGTFTFVSSIPVAAAALRSRTNERNEFLMTALPVTDLSLPPATEPLIIPQLTDGGGWHTEILLVNPTETPLTGTVEFWGQGTSTAPGQPLTVNANGQDASSINYALPPRSSRRIQTSGAGVATIAGWARIFPSPGNLAPRVAVAILAYSQNGVTVSETGAPAVHLTSNGLLHAEVYQPSRRESIETSVAIVNPSNAPVTVSMSLIGSDSLSAANSANLTIPANGQRALFLSEVPGFELLSYPGIFQGTVAVTAAPNQVIAVTGFRGRYNERGDFLTIATPPFPGMSSALQVLPHIVDGDGYSTQLIFRASFSGNAMLRFFSPDGQNMAIRLR